MKPIYDICVVGGGGHIGLPLCLAFAHAGKNIIALDVHQPTIEKIQSKQMPFFEEGAQELLDQHYGTNFWISSDKESMRQSTFIIIVIGTPVDEHLNPQFGLFKKFFDDIIPYLEPHHHIILRSTVYPGTTSKIDAYLKSQGVSVKISFCPERIAQGKAMTELYSLPQLVAACDASYQHEAEELFSLLASEVIPLAPLEAELAKLFTNTWRYIQFATANQFYQLAEQNGADFYTIYNAITHNYPRTKGFPGAGFAAGPCLFKDTMQLAAFGNNNFFLGHAAMLINEGMPNFIVQELKKSHDLSTKTVGILGMAFKANNDDMRESLSVKLKKIVEVESYRVLCSDIHAQKDSFVSTQQLLTESDIVILGTPHKEYADLTFRPDQVVVDIWNFYKKTGAENEKSFGHRVGGIHSRVSR